MVYSVWAFVWKEREKDKSRCGVVVTTLIEFNVHDLSGQQCVTYNMLGAIEKYVACPFRLKRSWIISQKYCWLVWCERKILFQLIIHDRISRNE